MSCLCVQKLDGKYDISIYGIAHNGRQLKTQSQRIYLREE